YDGGCGRIMKVWVCAAYADILAEPYVSSQRLLSVTRGAIIRTDDIYDDGYLRVLLNEGRQGYIRKNFVMPYKEPLTRNKACICDEDKFRRAVVDTAKSYLGTQYRWGGKTPLGIDCSGLTSMSYLLNGVAIFRDARIKDGFPVHEIAATNIKPGDLMYFPGHTAMYIGNCEYIHSTARTGSDGVVINSLSPTSSCYREDLAKNLTAVGSVF
ncbi:MAG: NlpC/P60 family protein, partial [Lachnospiraceae bacterium]